MLGSKEQRTKGMKIQAQELIDQAYMRGFKAGREDKAVGAGEMAYKRGLDDAWECARKICTSVLNGGLSYNVMKSIFGTRHVDDILHENTASEAIEKIKAWEQKKTGEVKIGDEVVGNFGFCGVIVGIDLATCKASVLTPMHTVPQIYPLNDLRKKRGGRHFPQIAEVLKQLKEEENADKD